MRKLWVVGLLVAMLVFAGCRNNTPPKDKLPEIPDHQEFVSAPAEEGEINMAIQTLAELGGGTLTLSEGVFIINGPINLISNMVLQGQGENTVVKLADGYNQDIRMIKEKEGGLKNVIIRNLVVDGNADNQTDGLQSGIFFRSATNITVENVTIKNCRYQGLTFGDNTSNCTGDKVRVFNNNYGAVLTANTSIINSYSYLNRIFGIGVLDGDNVNILNCYVYENVAHGIDCANGAKIRIAKNKCYKNGWEGVALDRISNSTVQDNEVFLNGQGGVCLRGGEDSYSKDNNITGNTIYGNNQKGYAESCELGVFNYSNNTVVQNNIIRRGDQVQKPEYGIIVNTYCNNTLISNNDLYQSGTVAAIRNWGANTNFGAGNRVNDGTWKVGADSAP